MQIVKRIAVLLLLLLCSCGSLSAEGVLDLYRDRGVKFRRDLRNKTMYGCYYPDDDTIHLRRRGRYESGNIFNHTALHELGHWARHPSRLGPLSRPLRQRDYYEEIVCDLLAVSAADALGLSRMSDEEVVDYIRGELSGRRLSEEQWRLIVDEVVATSRYVLGREISRERLCGYLVELKFLRAGSVSVLQPEQVS